MATTTNHRNINMVVPNTKGVSESFENIYSKMGFKFYFQEGNTIRNIMVAPKDK